MEFVRLGVVPRPPPPLVPDAEEESSTAFSVPPLLEPTEPEAVRSFIFFLRESRFFLVRKLNLS